MIREITLIYRKEDGKVVADEEKYEVLYQSFAKELQEGQKIEVYMSIKDKNDKTLGQLARINAMIRELARHTGESVDEMKKMVKIKAGLILITGSSRLDFEPLSFGDCSYDQLDLAIRTCMEMGVIVGKDF